MLSATGSFIDGAGVTWKLADLEIDGIEGLGPVRKGTFSAKALAPAGGSSPISGSFEVCVPEAIVCPI